MNTPQQTVMYEWKNIPWRKLERDVFKLQKRIFQATQRGDIQTVHRLQRLLMKSRAATLLAVRRVTQDNRGKKTAGIDGVKSLEPQQRNLPTDFCGKPFRRTSVRSDGSGYARDTAVGWLVSHQRSKSDKPVRDQDATVDCLLG
jgi:RNA-directed DNA polymerase